MKLHLFAVYDSKIRAFFPPFYVPAPELGLRAFSQSANDPESEFFKNPEDYTLFGLGTYDDALGKHELLAQHQNHGLAANFQIRSNNYVRRTQGEATQRDEARVLSRTPSGDSEVNIRPEPRAQDNV